MPTPEEIVERNLIVRDNKNVKMRFTNATLLNATGRYSHSAEYRHFYGIEDAKAVRKILGIKTAVDRDNLIKAAQIQGGAMLGIERDVKIVKEAYKRRNKTHRQQLASS